MSTYSSARLDDDVDLDDDTEVDAHLSRLEQRVRTASGAPNAGSAPMLSRRRSTVMIMKSKLRKGEVPGVIRPPDEWWRSLITIFGSSWEVIWFRVLVTTLIALLLVILSAVGYVLPEFSSQPHAMFGLPMGLLLGANRWFC